MLSFTLLWLYLVLPSIASSVSQYTLLASPNSTPTIPNIVGFTSLTLKYGGSGWGPFLSYKILNVQQISDASLSMIHILKMGIEVKLVKDVHSKISQTVATECFQFTNLISL